MKRTRFEPLKRIIHDATKEYAMMWGQRVIQSAKEAGASDTDVDGMRSRMNRWMALVRAHERYRLKVHAEERPMKEKRVVLDQMETDLDRAYQEIFW